MVVVIKNTFGASKEDVEKKKFNIYIGISLGNKWFTKRNIKEYILWALKNTKNNVIILIADKLQTINYEVRGKYSYERALKKALREGDKMLLLLKRIIRVLPKKQQEKIDIIRWEELEDLPEHKRAMKILNREFKKNKNFREYILKIVRKSIERKFNEEEITKLSYYVLNELPEMLKGFYYRGNYYNAYPYPTRMSVADFVRKIQSKKLFPKLYNELKIRDTVVVELKTK